MTDFYLTPEGAVTHGEVPDGATVIAYEGDAPFRGRIVLAAALTVVLRLQTIWLQTRWNVTPDGRRADLTGADLRRAVLTGADLTDAVLRRAVLTGAVLTGAVLTGAVLTGAVLRRAVLTGAVLTGADLRRAVLTGADLTDAVLRRADLTGADLTDAVLRRAVLTGADLRRAVLTGAVLTGADLTGAVLTGADFTGAVGLVTPEEEAATLDAAVAAIAREPALWVQTLWHEDGYAPATALEVGGCGSAHCLAGWIQAGLPLGHELRQTDAQTCGTMLAPRAAAAGWFAGEVHPDLQARVDAAKEEQVEVAGHGHAL